MTYKRLDRMIFEAALDILREEEADAPQGEAEAETESKEKKKKRKKPKEKIQVTGAYGTGGVFGQELSIAKSRATEDYFRLVKELGIKTSAGRNDLEKAASVISQTIKNNEIMAKAFKVPKALGVIDKKGRTVAGYEIGFASNDLKYRDAVAYVYATLLAAENAGVLKFDSGIGFVQAQLTDKPAFYGM